MSARDRRPRDRCRRCGDSALLDEGINDGRKERGLVRRHGRELRHWAAALGHDHLPTGSHHPHVVGETGLEFADPDLHVVTLGAICDYVKNDVAPPRQAA